MAGNWEPTSQKGIWKRGNRYVFSYRYQGKQRWESHRTFDAARRAKAAKQTDIDRGEHQERSRETLASYIRLWIQAYQGRSRGLREDTRSDYKRQIEQYIVPHFGERIRMSDVTPAHVSAFVKWLADENEQGRRLAVATIKAICAPLRSCFATAVDDGVLRYNPTLKINVPHREQIQDDDEQIKAMTREQLDMFLTVVHPQWRTFFEFLASTGLRISEAVGLEWRHLRLSGSDPVVMVRQRIVRGTVGPPKSRKSRRNVPLPHSLVIALRELRTTTEYASDDDPVFASRGGTVLVPGNVWRRVLKPAAEEAGVPWIGYHAFRHTCASMLIERGSNIVQVSRWLGHSSPAFTLTVYASLMDDGVGAALELSDQRSTADHAEAQTMNGANGVRTEATPTSDIAE